VRTAAHDARRLDDVNSAEVKIFLTAMNLNFHNPQGATFFFCGGRRRGQESAAPDYPHNLDFIRRVSESLSGFSKRFSDHLVKTGQTSSVFPNQHWKRASSNSNRRSSIFGPSKRWSGARSWIKSSTKVEGVDDDEEDEPAQRRDTSETAASGNIAREGFMASLALELILAQDLFSANATALLHRQSDLRELVHAIDLSFYTFRLASVEISRHDRLERLHFVLPEMAGIIRKNHTIGKFYTPAKHPLFLPS